MTISYETAEQGFGRDTLNLLYTAAFVYLVELLLYSAKPTDTTVESESKDSSVRYEITAPDKLPIKIV
jgi:hypothetical protein